MTMSGWKPTISLIHPSIPQKRGLDKWKMSDHNVTNSVYQRSTVQEYNIHCLSGGPDIFLMVVYRFFHKVEPITNNVEVTLEIDWRVVVIPVAVSKKAESLQET